MAKHDAIRPSQEQTSENIGLSALVVDCVRALDESRLRYEFQTRSDAQVAWTPIEVDNLLAMVGNATDVLRVVAWLVLIVAAIAICVALYNTMNERRREIAIMRSLGARRSQIVRIILQEAMAVAFIGSALGVLLCHVGAFLLRGLVHDRTGVWVDWAAFSVDELWLMLGVTMLGGLAGVLPALKGSRTPVADNLMPTS
jgi:putative ABC transport system permease protein